MGSRVFGAAMAAAVLCGCAAGAQKQDPAAFKKLAFLSGGTWHCPIRGFAISGRVVDQLTYEFSPDWLWMIERSNTRDNGHLVWSAQLWGYDTGRKQLVAYQFAPNGVSTKTVRGWVGDRFESTRDDNGATVTVRPINRNAFDWIIESADHSRVVTEACRR